MIVDFSNQIYRQRDYNGISNNVPVQVTFENLSNGEIFTGFGLEGSHPLYPGWCGCYYGQNGSVVVGVYQESQNVYNSKYRYIKFAPNTKFDESSDEYEAIMSSFEKVELQEKDIEIFGLKIKKIFIENKLVSVYIGDKLVYSSGGSAFGFDFQLFNTEFGLDNYYNAKTLVLPSVEGFNDNIMNTTYAFYDDESGEKILSFKASDHMVNLGDPIYLDSLPFPEYREYHLHLCAETMDNFFENGKTGTISGSVLFDGHYPPFTYVKEDIE